jgi:hypothetical protein
VRLVERGGDGWASRSRGWWPGVRWTGVKSTNEKHLRADVFFPSPLLLLLFSCPSHSSSSPPSITHSRLPPPYHRVTSPAWYSAGVIVSVSVLFILVCRSESVRARWHHRPAPVSASVVLVLLVQPPHPLLLSRFLVVSSATSFHRPLMSWSSTFIDVWMIRSESAR